MDKHVVPDFTALNAIAAVAIAFVFITIMSAFKEPARQKVNALLIAGAGAVYWNGGLGTSEYIFGTLMLIMAFNGLRNYHFIAIGWLLHTVWDVMHHLYGNPIVSFSPSSSAGCAVCDSILALWFFMKAPSLIDLFNRKAVAVKS